MATSNTSNYQTYILFFSWTIGLIAVMIRLFVKVELTQYVLAIALLDIVLNIKKEHLIFNKYSAHVITLVFVFYCWLLISNAYSASMEYKIDKSFNFIANIVFFIYPFFIRKINYNLLIRLYCVIILPLSAYFVHMKSIVWSVNSASTELFMNIRNAYLVFGMQLGILFLLLLYFKKNIILKVITFVLLIATGARGPLLFMLIIVGFYYLSTSKLLVLNAKNIFKSIAFLTLSFIVYSIKADTINSLLANSLNRFDSLIGGNDASALERVYRLEFSFYQPFENLSTFIFGNGIGSFGILYEGRDVRSYPHNILLECFFELGIIGLIIFLLMFLVVYKKSSFKKSVFGLLFVFVFLNAMKSSGITDLWILFSVMGAVITTSVRQEKLNDNNFESAKI